ncbi:MAG: hypothetical protein ACQEQV_04905 [Fibrobacterota bacterium]
MNLLKNKLLRNIIISLAILAAVITGLYAWYGGWNSVEFSQKVTDSFILVPRTFAGANPYKQAEPALDSLRKSLTQAGVDSTAPVVSLFYPPRSEEDTLLRYMAGFVISGDEKNSLDSLDAVKVPALSAEEARMKYKGYLSIVIGLMKMNKALVEREQARPQRPVMTQVNYRDGYISYAYLSREGQTRAEALWSEAAGTQGEEKKGEQNAPLPKQTAATQDTLADTTAQKE